jgi:hypothetical protein
MRITERLQTLLAAAAFAEENEHRAAIEFAGEALTAAPRTRETCTTIGQLAVNPGK